MAHLYFDRADCHNIEKGNGNCKQDKAGGKKHNRNKIMEIPFLYKNIDDIVRYLRLYDCTNALKSRKDEA